MKLGLMIRDVDYRDALVKKLSTYDKDIFVNIIDGNIRDASGAVILTDVPASGLEKNVLEVLKPVHLFTSQCFLEVSVIKACLELCTQAYS